MYHQKPAFPLPIAPRFLGPDLRVVFQPGSRAPRVWSEQVRRSFSVADRRQSLQRLDGGLISVTLPTARSNSCARPGTATAIDGAPLRVVARRLACGAVPDCHPILSFFFPPFSFYPPTIPPRASFCFSFCQPGRLFSRGQLGGAGHRAKHPVIFDQR